MRRRNNREPPKVMTWGKASPALVIAAIFDAIRFMFQWFWFFGPALVGVYCAVKVGDVWVVGSLLVKACGIGAVAVAVGGFAAIAAFGVIMAMATALAGWLAVGGWMLITNARIFKENALWFVGSLLVSEVPIVGSVPAFTIVVWKMYSHQIKIEKAALKKYQEEQATAQAKERNQQVAQILQVRAMQQAELDQEWQGQMAQQEEGGEESEQGGEEGRAIAETTLPHLRLDTKPLPSGREMPPPLPTDGTYPKLPLIPMPMPPPLPVGVPNYSGATPLPPTMIDSRMKERSTINTDERSVEQVALRNNAFIVHTLAESGQAQHHNANSNVSGKATYGDDMDIMLAFEPSISASSVTPGKKARLWTGDGFILGGGQISEAGGSDQGTIAHGIKKRGNRVSSLEEIDEAVDRNKDWHKAAYEKNGTFGMNELVVNNSEVFGFFQQAEKGADGRYWMFSTETKKDSEMAKRMRKYGTTAFDKNMENYRRRFATAQERGIPLYIMTPDREVYECLGVNDDGTVETGKQLTPEEVAKGRAGLSTEKRKEIGEKILKKNLFQGEKIQKEAEEIIKSL